MEIDFVLVLLFRKLKLVLVIDFIWRDLLKVVVEVKKLEELVVKEVVEIKVVFVVKELIDVKFVELRVEKECWRSRSFLRFVCRE